MSKTLGLTLLCLVFTTATGVLTGLYLAPPSPYEKHSVEYLAAVADSVAIRWQASIPDSLKTRQDSLTAQQAQVNSIYWQGIRDAFRTIRPESEVWIRQ